MKILLRGLEHLFKKISYEPWYWATDLKFLLNYSKIKVLSFKGNLIDFPGILIIIHGNPHQYPGILIIIYEKSFGVYHVILISI